MTDSASADGPGSLRDAITTVVLTNLLFGAPAYFIAFLFAYGFEDSVGAANHVAFLVMVGVIAAVAAAIAIPLVRVTVKRTPWRAAAAFALPLSAGLNLAAVGIGSIISAASAGQNSVTAGFSTATDVVVAVALLVPAYVCVARAIRSWRR